ncbi:DUF2848 domain-containing protein [Nocardia sp. NEAU-G5]|uniref:DUF2848 domain-containing protein n=1 Tax=Nocardia albiluteola TaxID=2842303 RepID=A0ABS6AZ51_9NOCA|nr:DUF2848 domain-containing protein [Nocardia albiluteola]MBU3062275.1 DUF2848 domain-containing protein [Nocardia albiluteola]
MSQLAFALPDGTTDHVTVTSLYNAGYAGRRQDEVAAHIAELAELGVPAPQTTPTLYPIAPYLAQQTGEVFVQHGRTSGEAEWALVVTERDTLLTVACDHTDRALEAHGVAWSKNAAPDVLGARAWRLSEVADHLDELTLRAWVGRGDTEELIQTGTLADLLSPTHWLSFLADRGANTPGTVLISGTISMLPGVDQFGDSWRVELADPITSEVLTCGYRTVPMPPPVE